MSEIRVLSETARRRHSQYDDENVTIQEESDLSYPGKAKGGTVECRMILRSLDWASFSGAPTIKHHASFLISASVMRHLRLVVILAKS